MPTISPVVRAVIGGNSEESFRQPRASVKASTGMDLPPLKQSAQTSQPTQSGAVAPESGQQGTKEDTTQAPAVTLSPQLTALARKQQNLQREIQAQRDKEAVFAAKEADYVPKSSFKAKVQQNAVEALADLGLTYDELTNLMLTQSQGDDPVKAIRAELEQLKSSQQENVSKQYEATVAQYRTEIDSLISSDENFITIKEESAQDVVLQHILDTFNDEGKILTVEAASKDIEDYLVSEAEKKLSLTKLKSKLTPQETKPEQKTLPPPKSGARTLTERVESAPTRTYNQFQHLSAKERLAQAIARAQK